MNDLAKTSQQGVQASQTGSGKAQADKAMVEFWAAMAELYGNQFISQWGDDPGSPGQWLDVLLEIKTIPENWKELLRISHANWPPNPLQFYSLMVDHGSIYGLPSFEDAWETAQMLWLGVPRGTSYKECHDLFYHMNLKGWFDAYGFRQATTAELDRKWRKKFKAAHHRCIEQAKMGISFKKWEERKAIPDKSQEPLPRNEAQKRAEQILENLNK